jgi:Zn-dependent peptidase ImmA (M78 family)/transcriptional regulator with XRE-family HTH domain
VTVRAIVEPAVLRWARETAGVAVGDAARRVQVKPETVAAWEAEGEARPTIAKLRALANMYKRPLSVFFLPQPPAEPPLNVHDFRKLPGVVAGAFSSMLRIQLRRARERRELAIDLLQDLEQPLPSFGIHARLGDEPEELGARLRELLGVDLAAQAGWTGAYDVFNGWRERIEAAGVLVFQMSRVDLKEVRGFSLAEEQLPVIAVNAKDVPHARVFTMLHELCHVALRASGICEPDEDRLLPSKERRVEAFCNRVAGAALVPMRELLGEDVVRSHTGPVWTDDELHILARRFSASRFVVLRRLLTARRTTAAFYSAKHEEWIAAARAQAQRRSEGGPPPDRAAVAERGQTFVRLVLQSYYQDRITLSDVSEYLGVRLKHLPKIEQALGF